MKSYHIILLYYSLDILPNLIAIKQKSSETDRLLFTFS